MQPQKAISQPAGNADFYRSASGAPPDALPPLHLSSDRKQSYAQMEQCIRRKAGDRPLQILEAGCGQKWPLNLDGTPFVLTAVDVDEEALALRRKQARDSDRIFTGDLRNRAMFQPGTFDVIYNSFVLEHIDDAQDVLDNFMHWLVPKGILIVRIPDGDSVYGFVTRATPLWMHVLYKKYVQGIKTAGLPGHDPYPVYYHPVVSRRGLHRYCREHACEVVYETGFSGYLPKSAVLGPVSRALARSIAALSLGRLDWRYNNLTIVIEKS